MNAREEKGRLQTVSLKVRSTVLKDLAFQANHCIEDGFNNESFLYGLKLTLQTIENLKIK